MGKILVHEFISLDGVTEHHVRRRVQRRLSLLSADRSTSCVVHLVYQPAA